MSRTDWMTTFMEHYIMNQLKFLALGYSFNTNNELLKAQLHYIFAQLHTLTLQGTIKSMKMGQVFYNNSFDFCRFTKLRNKIPILNANLKSLEKTAKFNFKCPFKKVINL